MVPFSLLKTTLELRKSWNEGYIDKLCTVFTCSNHSFVKKKLGFPIVEERTSKREMTSCTILQILISLKLFQDKKLIKKIEKEKEKVIERNLSTIIIFYCKRAA